jgi:lipopolysaccharide heptosyltransferase II
MAKFDETKISKLKSINRLYQIISSVWRKRKAEHLPIDKANIKGIIVMGMMMIGDTIMALPALRVLKRNFPNATITLVAGSAVKTILKKQSLIDDFVVVKSPWLHQDYSFKNLKSFLGSIKKINRKRYDFAIDFRGDWRTLLFMDWIKATRKISFNYTGGEYMLTDPIIPNQHITHYIEEWLYLLKQIGCDVNENENIPKLSLDKEDTEFINQFKQQIKLENEFVLGIHPGASQIVKKWDENKYAQLILKFKKDYPDARLILFEGPNETEVVSMVERVLAANAIDYTKVNKKLDEYILILSICSLIVCNDSGAAHIAGAFGVPTVVIFGNVDPQYVTPYGAKLLRVISHKLDCKPCHQNYCKFGTNICIKEIEVDEVYDAVHAIADAQLN